MPLSDYKGSSNSDEMWVHLVNERIAGTYRRISGEHYARVIVFESGAAFWFNDNGAFGPESSEDVRREVRRRKQDIEQGLAELRNLPPALTKDLP